MNFLFPIRSVYMFFNGVGRIPEIAFTEFMERKNPVYCQVFFGCDFFFVLFYIKGRLLKRDRKHFFFAAGRKTHGGKSILCQGGINGENRQKVIPAVFLC